MGAALVDSLQDPRLLLAAQRSAPPALAGKWELPGGKVEAGETPQEALHRELAEELGVAVVLGAEVVGPGGSPWPLTPQLEMRVWWAVLAPGGAGGGPAPLQDHHELRWLPRGQWRSVDWLPGDVPLIAAMESPPGRAG